MSGVPGRLQVALAERYTINRELGRGGMATVYLAEDLKHRRLVALKVLSPDLGAALGKDRFRSEEHTSELQSRLHLVCRLLLEKKNLLKDATQPPQRSFCDAT